MGLRSNRSIRFVAQLAPPLIAITLCLAASLLVIALAGYGPQTQGSWMARAMAMLHVVWDKAIWPSHAHQGHGDHYRAWIKSLLAATPLLLTGLTATVAFRAGVLNIGGEGQFLVGAIAATAVGLNFPAPAWLLLPALLLAGVAAGAILAAIAAVLEQTRHVPVVLSTLLLNFVAIKLLNLVLAGPLQGSERIPTSDVLPAAACLPQWLPQGASLGLHMGCALALAAALAVGFILRFTIFGFRLRLVGENPTAARFAGVSVGRIGFAALALSGALAGLGGAIQISGIVPFQLQLDMRSSGLGFAGIAVALLGRLRVGGVIAAALFFGVLNTAFGALQSEVDVPAVTAQATQGAILLAMLVLTHPLWLPRMGKLLGRWGTRPGQVR